MADSGEWSDDEILKDLDQLSGIVSSPRKAKSFTSGGRMRRRVEEPLPEVPSPSDRQDDLFHSMYGFSSPVAEKSEAKNKGNSYEWNETKEYEVAYQIRQVCGVNTNESLEDYYGKKSRSYDNDLRRRNLKSVLPTQDPCEYSSWKNHPELSGKISDTGHSSETLASDACSDERRNGIIPEVPRTKSPKKNKYVLSSPKQSLRESDDSSVQYFVPPELPNGCGEGEGGGVTPKTVEHSTLQDSVSSKVNGGLESPDVASDIDYRSSVKPREKKKRRYKNAIVDQLLDYSNESKIRNPDDWVCAPPFVPRNYRPQSSFTLINEEFPPLS